MGCIDNPKPDCPKLITAAIGLGKASAQMLGVPVDCAPAPIVQQRRDICRDCDHAKRNPARIDRPSKGLTSLSRCTACDCYISAKTMLASETCGLVKLGLPPKWGPVAAI